MCEAFVVVTMDEQTTVKIMGLYENRCITGIDLTKPNRAIKHAGIRPSSRFVTSIGRLMNFS